MRDAMEQVYRSQEFIELLDFLEDVNNGLNGNEVISKLMNIAEDEHGVILKEECWNKASKDLDQCYFIYANTKAKHS